MRQHPPVTDGNEAGFTLIELLTVLVIIGVLATIAIPTFLGQRERGWDASAKSDVRSLAKIVLTLETDGVAPVDVEFVDLPEAGFRSSPQVHHAICAVNYGFAAAAVHESTGNVFVVDFGGRLVESTAATMADALDALLFPETCPDYIED